MAQTNSHPTAAVSEEWRLEVQRRLQSEIEKLKEQYGDDLVDQIVAEVAVLEADKGELTQ